MTKRAFDIVAAVVGLLCLSPVLIAVSIAICLDSKGPVLFRQERIGKRFRPFSIYKFRTMVHDAPIQGGPITFTGDPRITRIGRSLRAAKLDELPQLINVLMGDMSIVGPRPEVRRYVDSFREEYREILTVRPGITDLASLTYRNEADILASAPNPEELYVRRILPAKLRLSRQYVHQSSMLFDLAVIVKTLAAVAGFQGLKTASEGPYEPTG